MSKFNLLLLSAAFVAVGTGCSSTTSTNTNTTPENANLTAEEQSEALDETRTFLDVYLIALEDAGATGTEIGCGDSVVAVKVPGSPTAEEAPETAITALLDIEEEQYGQSGLTNTLAKSNLSFESLTVEDGTATLNLSGDLSLAGTCDSPRVEAQLEQTLIQFDTIDTVDVIIDGTPLSELLSSQG